MKEAVCPECTRVAEVRFLNYDTNEIADRCGTCGVLMVWLREPLDGDELPDEVIVALEVFPETEPFDGSGEEQV